MTPFIAKIIWCIGVIGWFIIRYPYARRSKHIEKLRQRDQTREWALMIVSATGLGIIPGVYVFTGFLRFADYPFRPWQAWAGSLLFLCSLWLFRRTHKDLGRNWSVTLEVRAKHSLITSGVYANVRHPMYSAFWLWSLAQMMLLQNWIAGFAGLVGFGILFFLRIEREERLMIETFGDDYRHYMARTWRVLPGLF